MNLQLTIIIISFFLYSSNEKVIVMDKSDNSPIAGVEILSDEGSVLLSTDLTGMFNKNDLKKIGVKHVTLYSPEYKLIDFQIEEIPDTIYLEKRAPIELEEVVVVKSTKKEKYYTVKGYARSWEITDNKFTRYGDAIIEYHIPYQKSNNDYSTGVKTFFTEYRTFNIDSIKQKSRLIQITAYDSFFDFRIPICDALESSKSYRNFTLENIKDSIYNIIEDKNTISVALLSDDCEEWIKQTDFGIDFIEYFKVVDVVLNIGGESAIKSMLRMGFVDEVSLLVAGWEAVKLRDDVGQYFDKGKQAEVDNFLKDLLNLAQQINGELSHEVH